MSEGIRKFFKITHPLTPDAARTCMLLNICAWPGLGSRLAERKAGYVQMLMSLGGVFLFASALYQFMGMIWEETRYPTWHDAFVWKALCAIGVFLAAWVWSLFTSFSVIAEAKKRVARDPNLPPPL